MAIEPVAKIIPAVHLGGRTKEDAYQFVHALKLRLAEDCIPAFTSDGLPACCYAITAHFGEWVGNTRSLAKSKESLLIHVHWWRGYYHFARAHQSLRLRVLELKRRYRERTPAMAAGFTDHIWSVGELLSLPLVFEGGAC